MSNVNGVNGSSMTGYGLSDMPSGMSPDGVLAYCEIQLNGLGNETDSLIQQQEQQLNEQQACDNVQTTLESYGTDGPQSPQDMQNCVQAFQNAISSLPPGDPMIAQLKEQMNTMVSTYGYVAPGSLSSSQQQELSSLEANPMQNIWSVLTGGPTLGTLQQIQNGQFNKPASGQWQSTTDAIGNLSSNVKANANIQMLSLQNLMGQMQQAVEQSTQMLSSENSTLLDEAKNVGQ